MVVTRDHYRRLGRDWRAVIRPITPLAAQLDGAEAISARPLSVAGMPYGHLVADRDRRPVYRVGDQAAVIHSFTGDGMAIALRSARLAATALLEGKEASAYHQQLAGELRRALALAGSVDALAHGWFTRQLLLLACRALPGLIGSIARRTRVISNRPPQWT